MSFWLPIKTDLGQHSKYHSRDEMPYERTPEIREKTRQKALGRTMTPETKAKIAETLRQRNAKDRADKALREGTALTAFPFEVIVIEKAQEPEPAPEPIRIEFHCPLPDPNAWFGFEEEAPAISYWGI
jgi:hypothetical protein